MKVLIIVDVQNDFCPGGSLAVREGDRVVPIINKLIPSYPLVVATQDWHPAQHKSFASNNKKAVGETINLNGLPQVMWPNHCVQGTPGAQFVRALKTDQIEKVFQKGTDPEIDSYSGFFDNGHRKATGLGDFLKARGVTHVDVVGIATDYCVKFTALDAADLGFKTSVIVDATRGVDLKSGDVDRALEEMKRKGIDLIPANEMKPGEP